MLVQPPPPGRPPESPGSETFPLQKLLHTLGNGFASQGSFGSVWPFLPESCVHLINLRLNTWGSFCHPHRFLLWLPDSVTLEAAQPSAPCAVHGLDPLAAPSLLWASAFSPVRMIWGAPAPPRATACGGLGSGEGGMRSSQGPDPRSRAADRAWPVSRQEAAGREASVPR